MMVKVKLKNSDLGNLFKPYRSVEWSPIAMLPIKIRNTDAASGVIVYSSEKESLKMEESGKRFNKFSILTEGKISSMVQFAR